MPCIYTRFALFSRPDMHDAIQQSNRYWIIFHGPQVMISILCKRLYAQKQSHTSTLNLWGDLCPLWNEHNPNMVNSLHYLLWKCATRGGWSQGLVSWRTKPADLKTLPTALAILYLISVVSHSRHRSSQSIISVTDHWTLKVKFVPSRMHMMWGCPRILVLRFLNIEIFIPPFMFIPGMSLTSL